MKKLTIGERMKENYELVWRQRLPSRMPVIIRLDGKCFHTFTKDMKRPFDNHLSSNMALLSKHLCQEIQTTQIAYTQSDEISLLLHSYKKLDTEPWVNNEVQKNVSIAAGIASSYFSLLYDKEAIFDARVFVLPESEVVNYFVWRQQDATRNSISMLAQSLYSHKELIGKKSPELQELCFQKGINWNALDPIQKRGFCTRKDSEGVWKTDDNTPIFTQDRDYIRNLLEVIEE